MTLSITVSDRFRKAAADWADDRLVDEEAAIETKAEQALLEIEHLVAGVESVSFEVDGKTVHHEPSERLETFLQRQADAYALDPEDVLALYIDLFARAFLDDEGGSGPEWSDDPRPGR